MDRQVIGIKKFACFNYMGNTVYSVCIPLPVLKSMKSVVNSSCIVVLYFCQFLSGSSLEDIFLLSFMTASLLPIL